MATTGGPGDKLKDASSVKMLLEEEICSLISEVQDFNPSTIERIELPTALEFHRYIAANRPVIITLPTTARTLYASSLTNSTLTPQEQEWAWPAFTKWTNEYLCKTMGDKKITVACTPNGWADAVVDDQYFAMPCEKKMTFGQFLEGMPIRTRRNKSGYEEGDKGNNSTRASSSSSSSSSSGNTNDGIGENIRKPTIDPYQEVRNIQLQNGNLMTEYEELLGDVPSNVPFASEALGRRPDAVNFWYGDERSTTSLHKDHYENIYAVITGRKIFTLIPPTEQYCLHESQYIAATYVDTQDPSIEATVTVTTPDPSLSSSPRYKLEPMEPLTFTKWIALNPSHEPKEELFEKYPRFRICQPFRVELNPGELLYLPAMWYHQVEQESDYEGKCIAVNWWYDMGFEGDRYATATFMSNLVQLIERIG
ncbi:hypothetical protein BGZ65_004917 [Modicella reniformis]|uniref:JmjC domain-containing protein n=1 Tax=Modicella reniformis TaxID=1440133 RepID=A0A9P6MH33_9FUNG|nr:hypothetical protein BGZ65_004917 [Modicella reniformis]